LQGGEHGTLAAPVARAVIKAYYDKRTGQKNQNYTVDYQRFEIPQDQAPEPASAQVQGQRNPKPDALPVQPVSTAPNLNQ